MRRCIEPSVKKEEHLILSSFFLCVCPGEFPSLFFVCHAVSIQLLTAGH